MQQLLFTPLPMEDIMNGLIMLYPVLAVLVTAVLIELLNLFPADGSSRRWLMWVSAAGLAVGVAYAFALSGWAQQRPMGFAGAIVLDTFALFLQLALLIAALLVILSASTFLDRQTQIEGEFYSVVLFSTTGLMLMAAANELMTLYLALEVSSLSLAFLAAWNKRDRVALQGLKSSEAGMKFFLLSAMSTSILLFGMALLYGVSGTTNLEGIRRAVQVTGPTPVMLLTIAMLVAGFGFKIAAAPFQLWSPDVYQGAPTPVTAFFSVASKAAGFAAVVRLFMVALPDLAVQWSAVFGVLALITMTVGNFVAIVQTNIKRMMAYSSITHVGYMLIGMAAASTAATSGIAYYLLAYAFTNMAAFIVITIMARDVPDDTIVGYAGLARRSPVLGLGLTAALLSLAGIPPFAGFFSKLYLFLAALERNNAGLQLLVLWAVVMSAISLYYYGRIIHTMWMRDPSEVRPVQVGFSQYVALAASVVGMVIVGVAAAPFLVAATQAAGSLAR